MANREKFWQKSAAHDFGGPVAIVWDAYGVLGLEKANAKAKPGEGLVFEPDDLDSLLATIADSGYPASKDYVRFYGTERYDTGSGAHKALPGDFTRPYVQVGRTGDREIGYSQAYMQGFEYAHLSLRIGRGGKPCLWVYQEAPTASKAAKALPVLTIKRVSVEGNIAEEPKSATPRTPQINRSNRRGG